MATPPRVIPRPPRYGPPTAEQESRARGTKYQGRGPLLDDEKQARLDRFHAVQSGFQMTPYKGKKVAPTPLQNPVSMPDTELHNLDGLKWFGEA